MSQRIKTEDKWRVYAFYGEPDDLRMDGIEPETTYDHLLDDDSHSLDVTSKEAVFYQENGYEPQEEWLRDSFYQSLPDNVVVFGPVGGELPDGA